MNDKLCKKLRRVARDQTIGKPLRAYLKRVYYRLEAVFLNGVAQLLDNGKPKTRRVERATLFNHPSSTRGAYRVLKALWRQAGAHDRERLASALSSRATA